MNIVADTSAFVAILWEESDKEDYRRALLKAEKVLISAATAIELHIVISVKLGANGILILNQLIEQPLFEIIPVSHRQMVLATQAYNRFGKGRHPAKLNFGDLFSYALAKSRNLPLLFKGDDFSKTDINAIH